MRKMKEAIFQSAQHADRLSVLDEACAEYVKDWSQQMGKWEAGDSNQNLFISQARRRSRSPSPYVTALISGIMN